MISIQSKQGYLFGGFYSQPLLASSLFQSSEILTLKTLHMYMYTHTHGYRHTYAGESFGLVNSSLGVQKQLFTQQLFLFREV